MPANISRRLKGLVESLTHRQIRQLQSAIEEVDLHCDIIAQAPLEISQIILQYLPLSQIFQARRVSATWRQMLSSAHIVEPLLRDWFPEGGAHLCLQIPKGLSPESITSLKAEHIDAYRSGHAFTYARHAWNSSANYLRPELVAYADGIMAWVDRSQVKSLNLKTGQEWSFLPETGNEILAIAISSSMVVASTSNACYVWTLTTGESHCLRYPTSSCRGGFVTVSGDSLAVAYPCWISREVPVFQVLTWTLKDQSPSLFSIARPTNPFARKIILDSKGKTLLCFDYGYELGRLEGSMHYYYCRTNLDGDVLAQGHIQAPTMEPPYQHCSVRTVPKEANGRAVIWWFAKARTGERNLFELMLICYDFHQDRLQVCTKVVSGLGIDIDTTSNLFYWKDVAYYLHHEDGDCSLRVVDLQKSTCREAKMHVPISTPQFNLYSNLQAYLFGDDTFLIAVFNHGFRVWCFDKNVQMVNEDAIYKRERERNIKRRLESKREAIQF